MGKTTNIKLDLFQGLFQIKNMFFLIAFENLEKLQIVNLLPCHYYYCLRTKRSLSQNLPKGLLTDTEISRGRDKIGAIMLH